jgi:hypothetical protein
MATTGGGGVVRLQGGMSAEQFALNNSALVKEHYHLTHLIQLRSSPCQFVTTTTTTTDN